VGSLSIPATATTAVPDPCDDAAMQWGDGVLGSVCMSGSIQPDLPGWRTVGLPHLTNWPPISEAGAISEVA
jgi:hypothetical protein